MIFFRENLFDYEENDRVANALKEKEGVEARGWRRRVGNISLSISLHRKCLILGWLRPGKTGYQCMG